MKTLFVAAIIVLAITDKTYSQHLIISPVGEKTVAGWQYGTLVSFRTKSKWSFGGFYQQDLLTRTEGSTHPDRFYGLSVNTPIAKCEKINFYFNTRLGIANQYFVALVPGLETELTISSHLSLSTLMAIRMTYPSAAIKINIRL